MDRGADFEAVVRTFSAVLAEVDTGDPTTCCVVAYPRAFGSPPASDFGGIGASYNVRLSSLPCVIDLPEYVAVILYCTLRTRAFLPPGVHRHWLARNFKPCAGKGRTLSDAVKRHGCALSAAAAQSPQRGMGGSLSAASAPPAESDLLLRLRDSEARARAVEARAAALEESLALRVADLEASARAAEKRAAAMEERCRLAEAEHLRLRAEVQLVRATASAALAAAQKRPFRAADAFPR